ncbi:uncharacterized protein LOC115238875 isoform X2 [Formica exsecta]|uniref:uncharacterized protein LOC115238875 isoform X2 n=1 Tax=Formica exsecta TaxID=72781 RepID=UPI001143F22D|nr:uncharacterized protein LOC115238875 isoform X2 [Formica exsecta]XP_029668877.1 uncharacterized protein LOC115238875 isoform X2 [Formica exsecta]
MLSPMKQRMEQHLFFISQRFELQRRTFNEQFTPRVNNTSQLMMESGARQIKFDERYYQLFNEILYKEIFMRAQFLINHNLDATKSRLNEIDH